jgi:hypothetical protein
VATAQATATPFVSGAASSAAKKNKKVRRTKKIATPTTASETK